MSAWYLFSASACIGGAGQRQFLLTPLLRTGGLDMGMAVAAIGRGRVRWPPLQ